MPVITVKNLTKYYQVYQKEPGLIGAVKGLFKRKYYDVKAVDGVSFNIKEGELVGFIGPNGAGKTTTLKTLSGLLYPTSGQVSVLGYKPWQREPQFQKQFSLVMGQKNQLLWDLPASDSFELNREIYEIPKENYQKTLAELVALLEVEDILNISVRKLSLGQRMKLELIAALLHSPKILFLDEPTIGLDVVMQKKMRDFIKEYNRRYQATVILTSHYMDDVKELCERVIVIDKGRILFDGALAEIIQKFADHKTVTAVFNKAVEQEQLEKYGEVVEFDWPKVTFNIKREDAARITNQLLNKFDIDDLNVEEAQIEDIIREIFTSKTT